MNSIELPKHYHVKWRDLRSWYVIYQHTFLWVPYRHTIIGISTSIAQTLEMVERRQKFRGEK